MKTTPIYIAYILVLITWLFVALKITGIIDWNWVAVLSPVIIPVAGGIGFLLFMLIIIAVMGSDSGITNQDAKP